MAIRQGDQALYEVVSRAAPKTIDDVIATMRGIDAALPDNDGLKWFNQLYLKVTEQVDFNPPDGGWKDAKWLLALDVVFADFYFRAMADFLNGSTVASSWRALMEMRLQPGIDRIQFALAGMNAHINHDLALALLATGAQTGITPTTASPQYVDYVAVNGLLNTLMPEELEMLATDTLGVLAQDTGKVGRMLAFWDICKARSLAWNFADHLHGLNGVPRAVAADAQDQVTGVVGRAILAFV